VLHGCPSLQVLRLDGCRHITDAAFQPDYAPEFPLRACATLQTISFARCSQLTADLVLFLVLSCRALTDLNLSRCKRIPSDAIRQLLMASPDLERLTLSFMDLSDAAFLVDPLDASASPRSVLPRTLRVVDLTQSRITDRTILALASQCRYLEEVKLSHCVDVTDTGIETLTIACPRLRTLDLNNCGLVTDRGVALLGSHGKQLEAVNLSWCMNMTDKGVVDLVRGCEKLRQLKLVWCTQLTDVTMEAVLAMASSRGMTLHLSGCKAITPRMLQQARACGTVVVGL
jgi:F-box and leucine-rich repeat protein 2/20